MKTHTPSHTTLAVLNRTQPTQSIGVAALSLASGADGWFHLLPAGEFKAIDGRPFDVESGYWRLDEATAQVLIADLKSRVNPTVIDYEHQTLLADKNGQPAPASGWIKDAQWRESGLWIKADWTDRAQGYIKGGEYAYLSAVFPYDKATGKPLSLHSAALVARFGESAIADLEYGNGNAVAEAIADTTALIDGYVGSRYTLPLAEVPAIIARVARDLVFYALNTDPSDNVKARRDEAMSYLKDLAQGKVTLGVVFAIRTLNDPDGERGSQKLETARDAVRQALFGWQAESTTAPYLLSSSGLIRMENNVIWWVDRYQTQIQRRASA